MTIEQAIEQIVDAAQDCVQHFAECAAVDSLEMEPRVRAILERLVEPQARLREAVSLVQQERERQVAEEGWTPEHDDEHADAELAKAAAIYALGKEHVKSWTRYPDGDKFPTQWPWDRSSWNPGTDRIRELVKAGALIIAEIERLQRAALAQPQEQADPDPAPNT